MKNWVVLHLCNPLKTIRKENNHDKNRFRKSFNCIIGFTI
jgi:hypothetical protein